MSMQDWWNDVDVGGKYRSISIKTSPGVIWSSTNSTWTGLGLNPSQLPLPWHSQFIPLTAHTTNHHATIMLQTVHCLTTFHTHNLLRMHSTPWLHQLPGRSSIHFWILILPVHHQATVKHSEFIIPRSQPAILCTNFVEIHKQFRAFYPSLVSQYESAQVSKHTLAAHANHLIWWTTQWQTCHNIWI